MDSLPVRWGIVAPGRIAHRFAEAFDTVKGGKLQGVASRVHVRGERFAKQYRIPEQYTDYQSLIESDTIDAVYISSPHRFHYETIKACLLASKPVLCEKPLTVTAKQANELINLSASRQVFLMEALWTRCLPLWHQVKSWLTQGAIGDVVTMESSFGFRPDFDPKDRLFNLDLAGGALLDTGVYCLAMSDFVMDQSPTSVFASVDKGSTDVDLRTSALLNYGAISSQFTCTLLAPLPNRFSIFGTQGHIEVEGNFWDAQHAQLHLNNHPLERCYQPYRRNGFEYQIEEAQRCIAQGLIESPMVSHDFTLRTAIIMDEILAQGGVEYPFAPRH